MRALIFGLLLGLAAAAAGAVEPDEMLDDPALEARAREISKGLRCLVCQNQSIDESDASLARDLRLLVRERLVIGDSDQQVVDYLVSRYGDFVLLKPAFKAATLVLWLGPAVIAGLGVVAVTVYFRRRQSVEAAAATPLSDEEQRRLAALMEDEPRQ